MDKELLRKALQCLIVFFRKLLKIKEKYILDNLFFKNLNWNEVIFNPKLYSSVLLITFIEITTVDRVLSKRRREFDIFDHYDTVLIKF